MIKNKPENRVPAPPLPSTLQPQRILSRLLLATQGLPPTLLLLILLVVQVAGAHAGDVAVRAAAAQHPAHQRIHHVAHRLRHRLEPFPHGRPDRTERRVDARPGLVAVAAQEGVCVMCGFSRLVWERVLVEGGEMGGGKLA